MKKILIFILAIILTPFYPFLKPFLKRMQNEKIQIGEKVFVVIEGPKGKRILN